jgi:hypothetical protein
VITGREHAETVVLTDGEGLSADMVVVGVGVVAEDSLARACGSSGYDPTVVSFTAVPEPATWALMTLGFVVVGGAAYASRRRQAVAAV